MSEGRGRQRGRASGDRFADAIDRETRVESNGTGAAAVPAPGTASLPPMTLPQHGLTRYLRVRLAVADGSLQWALPRALLGIVPLGVRQVRVPLGDVRSARLGMVVRPLRLLAGVACIAVPLILTLWWLAVPAALLGLWVILVSFGPHLEVVTRTGARHRAGVCFGHRIDAELYLAGVNDLAGLGRATAGGESSG